MHSGSPEIKKYTFYPWNLIHTFLSCRRNPRVLADIERSDVYYVQLLHFLQISDLPTGLHYNISMEDFKYFLICLIFLIFFFSFLQVRHTITYVLRELRTGPIGAFTVWANHNLETWVLPYMYYEPWIAWSKSKNIPRPGQKNR